MMNVFRITFVNPASSPRASYEVVHDVHNAAEAIAAFWQRINPACVLDKRLCAIEGQVTVLDGRTPQGRTEWRPENACLRCGAWLSAHEQTTSDGDCFGCRAARRKGVG